MIRKILTSMIVLGAGLVLAQDVVRMGYIGGLSGGTAAFGVPALEGVQFAVNEINAAGGINGARIELTSFDDQGDPFNSQQGLDRLAAQGIRIVVSGSSSAGALAQVPRANQLGTIIISPLGSDPAIPEKNLELDATPMLYTNIPNNTVLGGSIARYGAEQLGISSVAVFIRDDAYGQSINRGFEQVAAETGMQIVRRVTYPVNAQDFSSDIAVVLSTRPDAIFLSGYAPDAGLIANQARLYGFSGTFLGTNPLTSPQYAEIAGIGGNNTYVSTAINTGTERTEAELELIAAWRQVHGIDPGVYHMGAYDSVYLFKEAIEAVGADPIAISGWLADVENYPGASGTITFNEDGSATKPVFIVHLEDDAWQFIDQVVE